MPISICHARSYIFVAGLFLARVNSCSKIFKILLQHLFYIITHETTSEQRPNILALSWHIVTFRTTLLVRWVSVNFWLSMHTALSASQVIIIPMRKYHCSALY